MSGHRGGELQVYGMRQHVFAVVFRLFHMPDEKQILEIIDGNDFEMQKNIADSILSKSNGDKTYYLAENLYLNQLLKHLLVSLKAGLLYLRPVENRVVHVRILPGL